MFEINGKKYYTKEELVESKVKKLKELKVKFLEVVTEILAESQKLEDLLEGKR